ncbi:MAG: phage portal protein [Clostridia bacterium]|nr:phage portal protein [Clostridia bacterium]
MFYMSRDELSRYLTEPARLSALIEPMLAHRRELYYDRYRRGRDRTAMMGSSRKKKNAPSEYYIVNMAAGYLGGKAPMYRVSPKANGAAALAELIETVRRYNDDEATFTELIRDYLIKAAAYLYIWQNDENEIAYAPLDAMETAAIYDRSVERNLLAIVRKWEETDADSKVHAVLEVIDDKAIRRWRDNQPTGFALHHWGDVPACAFENPDGLSIFEPAIDSIDGYEQIMTNILSMTQYNDDAKLLLVGYTLPKATIKDENGKDIPNPERKAVEDELLKAKVIAVQDDDGGIEWLLKDVNYDGLESVLKTELEQITMFTGVPNMTDEAFASADNATALGYKLYALDQYSATSDRVFKKGYNRLWELICARVKLRGRGTYDFRDIEITMQRNLPTDRDKSIDRAARMKSSGLFSDETCINESQVEVDAKDELKRRDEEAQREYDAMAARVGEVTEEIGNDGKRSA